MSDTRTPEEWMEELNRYALRVGYRAPGRLLNYEDWRDYYRDGYSPRDAIDEDLSYL